MTRRSLAPLFVLLILAACTGNPPPQASAPAARHPAQGPAWLDRAMGKTAPAVIALLGKPELDITEGRGRKLQFASAACVLDAYLYPPAPGGEPVVTHIDARLPGGDDFDRAACIAALARRGGTP